MDLNGDLVPLEISSEAANIRRYLEVSYRPCKPQLRTVENNDTGKCLVDDFSPETLGKKLN